MIRACDRLSFSFRFRFVELKPARRGVAVSEACVHDRISGYLPYETNLRDVRDLLYIGSDQVELGRDTFRLGPSTLGRAEVIQEASKGRQVRKG